MRKLNSWLLIVAVAIVFISTNVKAKTEEETSTKAAYELFDAMDLANTFGQTIVKMVDLQIQQNPKIAPYRNVMLSFFDKYMGWESLKKEMAKIYTDKFTVEEINKLKEFYQTPLGKKTAMLLPVLTAEGAALGQKRVQDNINELEKMIAEETEKINAGKK
ncbi:MAG: DUF2059 domain-containing protein [Spirochaetota bacterium]